MKRRAEWKDATKATPVPTHWYTCSSSDQKQIFLKIKLLLLLVKMTGLFQTGKDSRFFLLSIRTHPSAAPLSPKKPPTVVLMRKAGRPNDETFLKPHLPANCCKHHWLRRFSSFASLSQCRKTVVNSSGNKEIDHLNKRKALPPPSICVSSTEIHPGGTNIN